MEEVVSTRISAKRFAPIMIDAEKATFIDNRKCVRRINVHHIHDPYFQVSQSSSKPEEENKILFI